MPKPKLRLVRCDDWCALYKDGRAIYQGHDLHLGNFFEVLKANGISPCLDFASTWAGAGDEATATDCGELPQHSEELHDTEIKP